MTLTYNPPTGTYTTTIPAGVRAFTRVLAPHFGITRVEIVRNKSRCDKERSEHCECRGIDFFTTDPVTLRQIFDFCVINAEVLGIQSVIANRRVWGFGNWNERAYTGPSPHTDHAHIGLTVSAANNLTETLIRSLLELNIIAHLGEDEEMENARSLWDGDRGDVFVIGTDDEIYHSWTDDRGNTWQDFYSLGGYARKIITVGSVGGTYTIVVVGKDHALWRNHFNGAKWVGWTSDPGGEIKH